MVKAQKLVKPVINLAFFFFFFCNRQAIQLRIADRDSGKELQLCEPSKLARGSCESSAEGDKHDCDSAYRKQQKFMLPHQFLPFVTGGTTVVISPTLSTCEDMCEGYCYYIPALYAQLGRTHQYQQP